MPSIAPYGVTVDAVHRPIVRAIVSEELASLAGQDPRDWPAHEHADLTSDATVLQFQLANGLPLDAAPLAPLLGGG